MNQGRHAVILHNPLIKKQTLCIFSESYFASIFLNVSAKFCLGNRIVFKNKKQKKTKKKPIPQTQNPILAK